MNDTREEQLLNAGKAADAEKRTDVESLKKKYAMSNSVTKASKSFAFDNIIDEQRDMLKETVEEYPAITISLADKLLRMLGLADTTSVKKL